MTAIDPNVTNTIDPQALAGLKRAAHEAKPSADTLRQVASQFEALFMQMMLKSMRDASPGEDLFGSEQGNFYRDLYDQQLSLQLAKQEGTGLTEMLVRQLGGRQSQAADSQSSTPGQGLNTDRLHALMAAGKSAGTSAPPDATHFVQSLWPHAERAAQALGIAPEAIASVAALETGWGSSIPRLPDGSSSYNLFGIKADAGWSGARVSAPTVEYANGVAQAQPASFRAYGSLAESVDDFANFLQTNPRYRTALAAGGNPQALVQALAQAGYATDPAYAGKLKGVLNGTAMRSALASLKISDTAPIPT